MSTQSTTPPRIRYFQGQKLTARDLKDTLAYETRMHGLHLRGMHDTWGVALGFEVSVNQGRDTVIIGPGVAYDCHGRAVISGRVIQAKMPRIPRLTSQRRSTDWVFDLVIAYNEHVPSSPAVDCLGEGPSAGEERPAWRWVLAGPLDEEPRELAEDVRLGEEIPLGRFVLNRRRGISNADFSHRRNAQGLVRPHVGSGAQQGKAQANTNQLGYTIQIDTSAAGFTATPHYFANLANHPFLDIIDEDDPEQVQLLRFIQGPLLTIRNPLPSSFELDLRFAFNLNQLREFGSHMEDITSTPMSTFSLASTGDIAPGLPVKVNWVGIEDVSGCIQPLQAIIAIFFPLFQAIPMQMMVSDV